MTSLLHQQLFFSRSNKTSRSHRRLSKCFHRLSRTESPQNKILILALNKALPVGVTVSSRFAENKHSNQQLYKGLRLIVSVHRSIQTPNCSPIPICKTYRQRFHTSRLCMLVAEVKHRTNKCDVFPLKLLDHIKNKRWVNTGFTFIRWWEKRTASPNLVTLMYQDCVGLCCCPLVVCNVANNAALKTIILVWEFFFPQTVNDTIDCKAVTLTPGKQIFLWAVTN